MTTTFHLQISSISQVTSVFEMWKIGAVNNLRKWLNVSFACINNKAMQALRKANEMPHFVQGKIMVFPNKAYSC